MKRLLWLASGYVAGLGTAVWLRGRIRQAAERYSPSRLRRDVADRTRAAGDRFRDAGSRARDAGQQARSSAVDGARRVSRRAAGVVDTVRDAASEGRAAMRRVETELTQ